MSGPIKISTGKWNREGKVEVDGNLWTAKLPGSKSELKISQSFRRSKLYATRIELIHKKIENGTATEIDLDNYEEYCNRFDESEREIMSHFTKMFSDGTKDNSQVKKWVDDTPSAIIELAFESVKSQTSGEEDGQQEPTTSS